jgi:hypothetical protein
MSHTKINNDNDKSLKTRGLMRYINHDIKTMTIRGKRGQRKAVIVL